MTTISDLLTSRQSAAATQRAATETRDRFVRLSFYRLVWTFVICSVAGLFIETLVSYPIDHMWKNRAGFVWGPFSPIYGAGAVILTLLLNRCAALPNLAIFLISAATGATFEYIAGWFWESAFGIVAWSYRGQPFNIGDHTCLGMAVVWGLIGLVWIRYLLPRVVRLSDIVPKRLRRPVAAVVFAFLVADAITTVGAFNCWYQRSAGEVPQTPVQIYFDQHYGDDFMNKRFQTMSLYTNLADRTD
ncbi:putative ABC transporter permease [Collinsella sp. An2]|uniref:putative ABC transporter permease n=1 Tax=Collinsella sp. An2 TaxID=1965585 RepID=UPI000B366827|nr:putative ABC transporter permease [Collinsella sp. An2]OUP08695.1 hypothetical protein B5F33_06680 [Collinsella sp. An2]